MNIATELPEPLSTFVLDVPKNQYYDFELPPGSNYPLKGVTYPVDYGHILGYTSEDGHELDLFVGSETNGEIGYVLVQRGADKPNEHKFYVGLSQSDIKIIVEQLGPVLVAQEKIDSITQLLQTIQQYKNKA